MQYACAVPFILDTSWTIDKKETLLFDVYVKIPCDCCPYTCLDESARRRIDARCFATRSNTQWNTVDLRFEWAFVYRSDLFDVESERNARRDTL